MKTKQPFEKELSACHALDPIEQMRLVYCLLNGPIEDAITGDESAEHSIANAEAGLLALIESRGGNIDDIQP